MNGNPADTLPVLEVSHLEKSFSLEAGLFSAFGKFVHAVRDVSFSVGANSSLGLVGESGCGKTTTARLLVRMYTAGSGRVLFRSGGETLDVFSLKGEALKAYRRKVKYVFQDPARSLNPRMRIFDVLTDGWRWSGLWPGKEKAREAAAAVLEEAGLSAGDLDRQPGEFSGGQRQRISIARGLLMEPELLICDEVISALDVSIQGQILNLLLDLKEKRGLSFLFITHDLRAAGYFCDRIAVMYRGEILENAPARDLYRTAVHPYTKMLFASAAGKENGTEDFVFSGERGAEIPGGGSARCLFAERCPYAVERCFREKPALRDLPAESAAQAHAVRCHLFSAGNGIR